MENRGNFPATKKERKNSEFPPETISLKYRIYYLTKTRYCVKNILLFIFLWFYSLSNLYAQNCENFSTHVITTTADAARSVYAADVDGDGDMDVLSASAIDYKIAWYENDGNQIFAIHTITTTAVTARSVYAADVDGDGDMDVLSASSHDDKIAWYENDGNQNFSTHVITTSADDARSVYASDVDGDGDMDVLSASSNDDKIAWYENDGNQSFSAHTITTAADGAHSVYATDVDGDGDMDVLSASNDSRIRWYENDGNQNFSTHIITTSANGAWSVYTADIDDDGDMDVLSASSWDNKIAWYENDGSQNFSTHVITTSAYGARSVYSADVDGDGDMDVLSASSGDHKIAWYENDGNQIFSTHIITIAADDARSVYSADVDGDGDMDVLSASNLDDKIAWYENKLFTLDNITACDSYSWIDGNTYTSSNNTATDTLTDVLGCDSVIKLNLTINNNTGTDIQTSCDSSYTWIDGNTYTTSNSSATHTLTNMTGCDSVVTLNLTINSSNTGTDTQTACDSYTWIDGNNYTASNNTATHILTNVAGCDSVVTLNLTINNSNTGTDTQAACDSYSWIDGNTYTSSNNTATHTLTNAAGCDSVVTLDLTINNVDNGVTNNSPTLTANATGATYQWLDCDNNYAPISGETNQSFTATSSGSYAVEVTQNNCTDTSTCESVTVVGLQEAKKSELFLYPNPTTGILTIEGAEGIASVYNIYGRLVLTANTNTLDISNAAMGIYFVRVVDEQGKIYVGKVVKE